MTVELAVEYGGGYNPAPSALPDLRYDIAVVEPDLRVRMRLAAHLTGAQQFESIEDLTQLLRPGRPTVAVFGPGYVGPYGFQQVHRLTATYPELGPVFVVVEMSTELLQAALRAGARDAVAIHDIGEALHQSVTRVGELLHPSARAALATGVPNALVPGMTRTTPGRLVVVFSPKGGVGKSTVAINVAVAMARRVDDEIALVDADLHFGDVAVLLGLPPQNTIVDAAASIHYADPELMRSLVSRHESGLMVLPAPTEAAMGAGVSPDEMTTVCGILQAMCGWVIVDAPTSFDDTTLGLIEAADDVLLVASMDIPSIKNLKIGMQALDLMAIAGPKLRLVLNRANAQVKLDVREVEQVLGLRANHPVPYDLAVPLSVNAGVPVVLHDPRSAAARALEQVASSLLGEAAPLGLRERRRRRQRARR